MNSKILSNAIEYSLSRVDEGLKTFKTTYPEPASVNGVYMECENVEWTNGFWTGMLWLAYEFTKDKKYLECAFLQVDDFYNRIENKIAVEHHDMGFLYSLSCVAAYKLTENEKAKNAAIMAAENLYGRFQEKGQFIQAWGELGTKENYHLIIDCMMNVPLLFWASEVTENDKYQIVAKAHMDTTVKLVIRQDFTTYHSYFFDVDTGKPLYGVTHQGYSDDSIWARGQAWGVYGLALAYGNTKNDEYMEKFLKVTDVFLDNLPKDNIPCWDLVFKDNKTLKDTSASAIVICGILEMSRLCKLPDKYVNKAEEMMESLINNCLTTDIEHSNGILKHGVYSIPHNSGIDECNIWGDYYFMEALMRMKNINWDSYWK